MAKIEALADDIEASAEIGHDTENQLSNNLITITLAFVALLAASVSTSDVLTTIDQGQEILMMSSIAIFSVSIFVGLVLCVAFIGTMLFHTARVG